MHGMFLLRDLPKYEAIRQRASRYPDLDPRGLEAFLVLLRVASDVLDGLEALLASHGTSQGKFTVLMLLHRSTETGISPSDLAARSGVTRATITGLLEGLCREKFVVREGDTGDRRKAVVRLTPRGRRYLEGLLPDYYRKVAELMQCLTDPGEGHARRTAHEGERRPESPLVGGRCRGRDAQRAGRHCDPPATPPPCDSPVRSDVHSRKTCAARPSQAHVSGITLSLAGVLSC
jgi:DNA-binding MarR family transcriptional regulator